MISFLFWNIDNKDHAADYLARLALTYTIDVILLAECPDNTVPFLDALNGLPKARYEGRYNVPAGTVTETKVQVITRLPPVQLSQHFTNLAGDMTIWKLRGEKLAVVLLAVVHLSSKSGGVKDSDQQDWMRQVAQDIADVEDRENSRATVLVGDLNANPFDPAVVSVTGLFGVLTRELAGAPDRKHRGKLYRRFYNPMWGLFGDRTAGPAGTHYWNSSVPSNRCWHMLDQVLLRPGLMGRLCNLQVLDSDGYKPLTKRGVASKEYLSDHLPILFQLDL